MMVRRKADSDVKGRLLEEVSALMHDSPGVDVRTRAKLPCLPRGLRSKRRREIDVLITAQVAGYPVRIAIECKNERKRIGPERIDAFVGKLTDVGIPVQHGVFVSASGFTDGALGRAEHAGIRALLAAGLTKDRLALEVAEALASVIYVAASIEEIALTSDHGTLEAPEAMLLYHREDPNKRSSILHLIWL